jgi:pimeloyl-ACP methyl ester carboxylesterase
MRQTGMSIKSKKPLANLTDLTVYLHGALGAASDWTRKVSLVPDVSLALDFAGHGHTPFTCPDFYPDSLMEELRGRLLQQYPGRKLTLIGYSFGGYVAARWAFHYPSEVQAVTALATRWIWTPEFAKEEAAKLQPELLLEKAPALIEQLKQQHGAMSWRALCSRTADMMHYLGEKASGLETWFPELSVPLALVTGDRDRMATAEQTLSAFRLLKHPEATLQVLPKVKHPLATYPDHLF